MKFKDAVTRATKKFTAGEFIERIREEDDTMLRHLDVLEKINGRGYITTESQAGRKHSGVDATDGRRYQIEERAYVAGFMLEAAAAKFIRNMALFTDKNAVFIPTCEDSIYVPSQLDIPLTITKKAAGRDRKPDQQLVVNTHASTALPRSVWEMYRKELHINKGEPIVFIQCWDPKWCRGASGETGLFTDVLRVLKMST